MHEVPCISEIPIEGGTAGSACSALQRVHATLMQRGYALSSFRLAKVPQDETRSVCQRIYTANLSTHIDLCKIPAKLFNHAEIH